MAGRKQKPNPTSWGEIIPGLNRQVDGRWRIVETGQRYTEPDERTAIDRYYQIVGNPLCKTTAVEGTWSDIVPDAKGTIEDMPEHQLDKVQDVFNTWGDYIADAQPNNDSQHIEAQPVRFNVPDAILWPWIREQIVTKPEWFTMMVGLPELAGWRYLHAPVKSITLAAIRQW